MKRLTFRLCAFALSLFTSLEMQSHAKADCDPKDFMVQDKTIIQQSEQIQIAYVLTSTREQFDKAKSELGFLGKLDFTQAKESAQRIAEMRKFDYMSNYSLNFLEQRLSGEALKAYVACLTRDRERPGIVAWIVSEKGAT